LDAQLKRGMIEACILSLLDKGDSYGYQLIKDLSDVMELSESTLYPVLRRLEAAQALTTYTKEHSSRLRKYYAITETGRHMIDSFLAEWAEVTKVYDYIRRTRA
jgi:PadR family transcriptional regulator, regulatory protein PadR